jgi:hypothetical protein
MGDNDEHLTKVLEVLEVLENPEQLKDGKRIRTR